VTPETTSLTSAAALSAIMWIPYVLNGIAVRGWIACVALIIELI
jgi:hypothetical protein